jgi:endo-1,3(4)-beta-glucanase
MDALIHRLVTLLKQYLQPWLEGTNPNALLYDTLYGGIVSTNGLKDFGADFGQGLYNDHHFHYGYIAYACAVVAHFDPSWGRGSHRDALLALVRDYANPSLEEGSPGAGQDVDGSFARLRHFDPFDSHSWASGLFVFSDGRNQESSSEAINAYYSLGLLGHALNQPSMRSIGRALMTLEAQGAHFYWHSTDSHSVYPSIFADNKCAGMVWSDKVVDATWFAAGKVYVHGINLLPFTPASELYATSAWAKEQFPVAWASLEQHDAGDDWRGFLRGAQCAFDAPAAWKAIEALTSFDGGNTRANLMHFCATRPPTQQQQQQQMQDDDDVNDFPAVVVGVPSSILLEQPSSALVQDA